MGKYVVSRYLRRCMSVTKKCGLENELTFRLPSVKSANVGSRKSFIPLLARGSGLSVYLRLER